MLNVTKKIFLLFILILQSCSSLKSGLGLEKKKPDEFLIKKIDPIIQPPDYELLPPDSKTQSKIIKQKKTSQDVKDLINSSMSNENNNNSKVISENINDKDVNLEILNKIENK